MANNLINKASVIWITFGLLFGICFAIPLGGTAFNSIRSVSVIESEMWTLRDYNTIHPNNASWNLSIGQNTTTTNYKLHVDGNTYLDGTLEVNGKTDVYADLEVQDDIIGNSRLFMPDGTNVKPSYTFTSDTDTGFYRSAGNQVSFVLGGIDVFNFHQTQSSCYNSFSITNDLTVVDDTSLQDNFEVEGLSYFNESIFANASEFHFNFTTGGGLLMQEYLPSDPNVQIFDFYGTFPRVGINRKGGSTASLNVGADEDNSQAIACSGTQEGGTLIGATGYFTPVSNAKTYSPFSGTVTIQDDAIGIDSSYLAGAYGMVTSTTTHQGTLDYASGLYGRALWNGGEVDNLIGARSTLYGLNGYIDKVYGFEVDLPYVLSLWNFFGGITNYSYGMYLPNISVAEEQNYSIYSDSYAPSYFYGNISARDFIDNTPAYDKQPEDALREICAIETKEGKIDHSTLPDIAKQTITREKKINPRTMEKIITLPNGTNITIEDIEYDIVMEEVEGRSLSGMITTLTEAIKELSKQIDELEKRVIELEKGK